MASLELQVRDFDLEQIFECGQCFRWDRREDGSYLGVAGQSLAKMSMAQESGFLKIELLRSGDGEDENFWKKYLDLDRDYGKIKEELCRKDEKIREAVEFGSGIRILSQDPFEMVISFIISQNSNIPRIKKCINSISEKYGKKIGDYEGRTYYAFPTPNALAKATEAELMDLKLGYRAAYIVKTVSIILGNMDNFDRIESMEYEEAKEFLLRLSGIGPKVADCILLFGLRHFHAFPIDVWVKRIMHEAYGFEEKDLKGMQDFAKEKFGENAGLAQQYLFYYIRGNS